MTEQPADEVVPGLPAAVVRQLDVELGKRAIRIRRCLRTADALIEQAKSDEVDLRLTASAAYNLREALDSVVKGVDPAEGGLRTVAKAWREFRTEVPLPDTDTGPAWTALAAVLDNVASNEDRLSAYGRRLLTYLQRRAGIGPVDGEANPIAAYSKLRDRASDALHSELDLTEAAALHRDVLAWFIRMFTPPDDKVDAIRELAAQPWRGEDQVAALSELAVNDHHLRLFFGEVTDASWLEPLRVAGVLRPPQQLAVWPGAALVSGIGRSNPKAVADVLDRLFQATKQSPEGEKLHTRFELLRVACQLGPAGHGIVAKVARVHSDDYTVRLLSVGVVRKADPTDRVVCDVARAVLENIKRFGDDYHATTLLDQLQAGLTEDNITERGRMLAGKVRSRAEQYTDLGLAALTVAPGEHPELLLLLAHHLVRLLATARTLGVSSATQSHWLGTIEGEVGERVRCQFLAEAQDIPLADKIAHIVLRLESTVATGDDLVLVQDILSQDPPLEDLAPWRDVLGLPSAAPSNGLRPIPRDWERAWRWSAVLPDSMLARWRDPIERVTSVAGVADSGQLTGPRAATWRTGSVPSPYSVEQLASLPVLDAAALVAGWQPAADSFDALAGPFELARALQETIKREPAGWTVDPTAVVAALRKPIYVERYFYALAESAARVLDRVPAVLIAAEQVRTPADDGALVEPPTTLAILAVVRAFANHDADITADLDDLWHWTSSVMHGLPSEDTEPAVDRSDIATRAVNRTWGVALETALSLAVWEFRRNASVRPTFDHLLDYAIDASGSAGLELRSILMLRLHVLSVIAKRWLAAHVEKLFRSGPHATATVDIAVSSAQPTVWLYENLQGELFEASRRGADGAPGKIAIAVLDELAGYDATAVINALRRSPDALARVAEDIVFLVQDSGVDPRRRAIAIGFWDHLLDANRREVPASVLSSAGRWAFVADLVDNTWLHLTTRTLDIAGQHITGTAFIADRAAAAAASSANRKILLRLLDIGEPWERHHAAGNAVGVLSASVHHPVDESFTRLRSRLIELGHHSAKDISPREAGPSTS